LGFQLRDDVTLTFDLLIFNVCGVSAVTWSYSETNFSEIEQSTTDI